MFCSYSGGRDFRFVLPPWGVSHGNCFSITGNAPKKNKYEKVVWHDWVVDLPPAAPPNEKPPPPPLDDDLPVTTPSTPTAPSPVASDAAEPESTSFAPHQVTQQRHLFAVKSANLNKNAATNLKTKHLTEPGGG